MFVHNPYANTLFENVYVANDSKDMSHKMNAFLKFAFVELFMQK